MKKFTLAALIFVATIANAETINPKEEFISQDTQILTTGIEWLDKELLLNSGLLIDNQGNRIKSSNKSFAELKTQLKQQYEKSLKDFNGEVDVDSSFRTEFIKQKGDTVIFVTYDTGCVLGGSGGSCWDSRREIHFDLNPVFLSHF